MKVRVLLFSVLRDLAGVDQVDLDLPAGATLGEGVESVHAQTGRLAEWKGPLLLAVNGSYAGREQVLAEGDEVAMMPPVQGG